MIAYAVILTALITVVKNAEECGGFESIEECFKLSPSLPIGDMNELPGEDTLDEFCGPYIKRIECVRDEMQKCSDPSEYIAETLSNINTALALLYSVCDEASALRKGYIENVGCYNTVFPQMVECANSSVQLVLAFIMSSEDDPEFEGSVISIDCLTKPLLLSCAVEETKAACGDEATEPLATIAIQISSIIKESKCPGEDELSEWEARFILFVAEQAIDLLKK